MSIDKNLTIIEQEVEALRNSEYCNTCEDLSGNTLLKSITEYVDSATFTFIQTVFVFCKHGYTTLPSTAVRLDVSTGELIWEEESEWSTSLIEEDVPLYTCVGRFDQTGSLLNWSGPVQFTGTDGDKGDSGKDGEDGMSFKIVTVYTSSNISPGYPDSYEYDYENNKINEIDEGWYVTSSELDAPIWMAIGCGYSNNTITWNTVAKVANKAEHGKSVAVHLTNDSDFIPCDDQGIPSISNLTTQTDVKIFYGGEEVFPTTINVSIDGYTEDVPFNTSINGSTITFDEFDSELFRIDEGPFRVKIDVENDDIKSTVYYNIHKIKSTTLYTISTTPSYIHKNKNGELSSNNITVSINEKTVDNSQTLTTLPEGFSIYVNDAVWDGFPTYNISDITEPITFRLYNGDVLLDLETVSYTEDGQDGPQGEQGTPGADGVDGKSSPVIYSAGTYNPTATYEGSVLKAPYVFDPSTELFYIAYGNCSNLEPEENIITNPDWNNIETSGWILMDKYETIYSDIGVFKQALVGKWVFHGDYMFSQDGVWGPNDTYGTPGSAATYEDVIADGESPKDCIKNKEWTPNIYFNAVTGDFYGSKGSLSGVSVSNGDIDFDERGVLLQKDGARKITIYNGELKINSIFGIVVGESGSLSKSSSNSVYLPQGGSGTYQLGFDTKTPFLSATCDLKFGTFYSSGISISTEGQSVPQLSSAAVYTAKLYWGDELLHTISYTTAPTSSITWDLSELNSYVDLQNKPGVYSLLITISGSAGFTDGTSYGNCMVSCNTTTLNWTYSTSTSETIIGSNGLCALNKNGYTMLSDWFESIQGLYGLKISSGGIHYTSDGGSSWQSLV